MDIELIELISIIIAAFLFLLGTGTEGIFSTACYVLVLLFFICAAIVASKEYDRTHREETSQMIITVEDKFEDRHYVGVPGKGGHYVTDYYVIFDHDNQIEVDSVTYDKYKKGDSIMISKTTTYKINDDGSTEIEEVEWNQ